MTTMTTSDRTCSQCFSQVNPRAKRCPNCGSKMSAWQRSMDKAQRIAWTITGSVILLMVAAAFIVLILSL